MREGGLFFDWIDRAEETKENLIEKSNWEQKVKRKRLIVKRIRNGSKWRTNFFKRLSCLAEETNTWKGYWGIGERENNSKVRSWVAGDSCSFSRIRNCERCCNWRIESDERIK